MRVRLLYMRPKRKRKKSMGQQERSPTTPTFKSKPVICFLPLLAVDLHKKTMHRIYALTVLPTVGCPLLRLSPAFNPFPQTRRATQVQTTNPTPLSLSHHDTLLNSSSAVRLRPRTMSPTRKESCCPPSTPAPPFFCASRHARTRSRAYTYPRDCGEWFVCGVLCVWVSGVLMVCGVEEKVCGRTYLHLRGALPVHDPKLRHRGAARVLACVWVFSQRGSRC